MPLSRITACLAFLTSLTAVVGCDTDTEIPDELVLDRGDEDAEDDGASDDSPDAESQALNSCQLLGSDRSCGADDDGVQFCAWLYNEETAEVATYWGECVSEPECSLWSCRDRDQALCDLVDGKPQWVAQSCDW